MYEWLVFFVVLAVGTAITFLLSRTRFWRPVADLLLFGFFLRVLGSQLRHWVIYSVYGGSADAARYFHGGLYYRDAFWSGDTLFSTVHGGGQWWGTNFMQLVTGIVVTVLGDSKRAVFLAISLFGFMGIVLILRATTESLGSFQRRRISLFLLCLPTLWFWPSSIGKEAVVTLAVGLALFGYIGRTNVIRWVPLVLGLALAFAIRPHVAGVLVVSMAAAEILRPVGHWSPGRVLGAAAVVGLALFLLSRAVSELGLSADAEGVEEFLDKYNSRTLAGDSQIGAGGSLSALLLAPINVLMRPFLFEAHNGPAMAAAVETTFVWGAVIFFRARVIRVFRLWRKTELMRFLVPFFVSYTFMIGVAFSNLGILARQRSIVFPLIAIVLGLAWSEGGRPREKAF